MLKCALLSETLFNIVRVSGGFMQIKPPTGNRQSFKTQEMKAVTVIGHHDCHQHFSL